MYRLIIANKNYSSWSLRPWVLLRTLGIAFEEKLIPFGPHPPGESIAAVSPSGKVPCLVADGETIWDSLAIVEFVAERHAGVWPAAPAARAWARCAAAEMHSGFVALRSHCGMSCGQRVALHALPRSVGADLVRIAALWEQGLARFGGPFLAGPSFTAVDAFFAPVAFRVQTYALAMPGPALGYVQRLLALPAMRAWYAQALGEPWRDAMHEADTQAVGNVTEDFRAAV